MHETPIEQPEMRAVPEPARNFFTLLSQSASGLAPPHRVSRACRWSISLQNVTGGRPSGFQMMDTQAELQSDHENCASGDGQKQPKRHGDLPIHGAIF
jgi:hypothetical protein